jgi:EREBP-like factor
MAARAHDVAAIALRGRSACLNFADSLWRLPIPASGEVKDIQEAATLAAENFRPSKSEVEVEERTVALPENVILIDEDVDSLCLLLTDPSFSEETLETTVEERTVELTENLFYIDEDAVFEIPELLANIAEGLMLCPPEYVTDGHYGGNDMEFGVDISLWSCSM